MRARAEGKAPHDQYPAPYALIDLWERHGGSRAVMMAVEKPSFARLAVTSTAQNLVRMFFLREQMKRSAVTLGISMSSAQAPWAAISLHGARFVVCGLPSPT